MKFGDAILWKRRPVGGALGKLSCLWEDRLHSGIQGQSGELTVSDREGVWRTSRVQRKLLLAGGRPRDDPEDVDGPMRMRTRCRERERDGEVGDGDDRGGEEA